MYRLKRFRGTKCSSAPSKCPCKSQSQGYSSRRRRQSRLPAPKKQVTETKVSVTLFCRRGRKPVSVIIPIIYLRNLPPDIGRAALICQYIWFCRPWYHTRPASLTDVVSSYLAFSPSPSGIGRQLFSVTVSKDYSHLRFPQQGALSCPDFPH